MSSASPVLELATPGSATSASARYSRLPTWRGYCPQEDTAVDQPRSSIMHALMPGRQCELCEGHRDVLTLCVRQKAGME